MFILLFCLWAHHPVYAQTAILDYANETDQATAQGWSGFVAAGTAVLPEYDGAEDYQVIPVAALQLNKGNYYIATRGLGFVANVIDSPHFNAGPIVRFRFGRDDDVDNARIAQLRALDDAVETGAFISAIQRNLWRPGDNLELSLSAAHDVAGGHGGLLADISASYFVPVRRDLRLGFSASLGYQSDDYAESYFTIDANNAARSGLQQYDADGGLNNASAGIQLIYAFDQRWGIFSMLQYSRLLADAADSPIVDQEGNANQLFGVVAVSYRF